MSQSDKDKRRRILTAIALAVGVLNMVLAVIFLFPKPYVTSWGEEIDRRESFVYVDGETLTQDDLEAIAALPVLRNLSLTNCNVAECRLPELRFASKKLSRLELTGTEGLWDLSFLAEVPAEYVTLADCIDVDGLSTINCDVVTNLDVSGTSVTDLTPLAGSQLSSLSFAHTEVSDLSPLAKMPELWEVDGSYTKVSSLDALNGAKSLSCVTFDGCPITELPQSLAEGYLRTLNLSNTQVEDFSVLEGCAYLSELNVAGNPQVTDMSWLSGDACDELVSLNVAGTGLDASQLAFLSSCPGLERLYLDGIALDNLDLCKKLHNLTYLSAVGCGITDISSLRQCPKLETVLLGYNQVKDLKDLPTPSDDWSSLVVDLSHNGLTSLEGLPVGSYRFLFLQGNDLDYTKRLPEGLEAYVTVASWGEGIEKSALTDDYRFSTVYLLDCPTSELEQLEAAFSRFSLRRINQDELLYRMRTDGFDYGMYVDMSWYVAYAEAQGDGNADKGAELVEEGAELVEEGAEPDAEADEQPIDADDTVSDDAE